MRPLSRLSLAVALVAGCDSLPPAPSSESAAVAVACGSSSHPWGTPGCPHSAAPRGASAAPSLPAPRPRPPASAPTLPGTVVEVEVSGQINRPRDAPEGRLLVALTDGPCFQPGTHYLAWAQPGPSGTYLLDVFPPVGTRLEACGAIVEPLRRGLAWWGRADRGTMEVQGRGKMAYQGTSISLRRGPELPLPVGLQLAP